MTDSTLNPTDATVIAFPSTRGSRRASVAILPAVPADAPESSSSALFEPVPDPPNPRPRKRAAASRPRPKSVPRHSPEHKRALEITALYQLRQPVCDEAKAAFAIRTAILAGQWTDEEIVAAVERVADSGYPLTTNSLSYQLRNGRPGAREIDPVIHQAIDSALKHLNALDSERMTATERTLAAAVRLVAVAVAHVGAEMAKENPA